jgi:AcrR family transcriptional regulator
VIHSKGIDALTLRAVGEQLGVSRSALYRHFADKQALLGAVAAEGFRLLRTALLQAWNGAGQGAAGFDAMGSAYVQFALDHTSHYRVMFGGFVPGGSVHAIQDPETDAFQTLVDAIVDQQRQRVIRDDDPRQLAMYIWAVVHGVAMLAVDGMLSSREEAEALTTFAIVRLRTGIAPG